MIGAALVVQGIWAGDSVFNIEQMNPDPFMEMLMKHGLRWQVQTLNGPLVF